MEYLNGKDDDRIAAENKEEALERGGEQELSQTAIVKKAEYESHLNASRSLMNAEQLEEAMQKIMDQYAGGIGTDYRYSGMSLAKADEKIAALLPVVDTLAATDTYELMQIYELRERLIVCQAVIAHLAARKETRWHSFGENTDYPQQSEEWMKYVNSRMENGEIKILYRDLITKENTGLNTAAIARVIAGIATLFKLTSLDITGKIRNRIARKYINSNDTKKLGRLFPIKLQKRIK